MEQILPDENFPDQMSIPQRQTHNPNLNLVKTFRRQVQEVAARGRLTTFSLSLYLAAASATGLPSHERNEYLNRYGLRVQSENQFCIEVIYEGVPLGSSKPVAAPLRIVAFRGTDLKKLGWGDTFTQAKADIASLKDTVWGNPGDYKNFQDSKYLKDAYRWFCENLMNRPGAKSDVICTGHSLGGLTAMHIATRQNLDCITFCPGPGIAKIATAKYTGLAIHLLPVSDWIGISPGFAYWQQIIVPMRDNLSNSVKGILTPHKLKQYAAVPESVDAALFDHLTGQAERQRPDFTGLKKNASDPARLVPDDFVGQEREATHGHWITDNSVFNSNHFGGSSKSEVRPRRRRQSKPRRNSRRKSKKESTSSSFRTKCTEGGERSCTRRH